MKIPRHRQTRHPCSPSCGRTIWPACSPCRPRPRVRGRYLYWDELRHRPPPAGVTLEEWWLSLWLNRAPLLKALPLQDKQGAAFRLATQIEVETIRSILNRTPKRADVYWFIHVQTADEPFLMKYHVDHLAGDDAYYIKFKLGFRVEPRINLFLEHVLADMQKKGEIGEITIPPEQAQYGLEGDLRFVLLRSFLSYENDLTFAENVIMRSYYFLRRFSIADDVAYGLDTSNVVVESVPVVVRELQGIRLERDE